MLKAIINAKNKLIYEAEPDIVQHNAGKHSWFFFMETKYKLI